MPDPFISRDDLSDYLGRDVSSDDGALIAVDAACDAVRTVAEQDFNQGTSTIKLDGTGTDCLLLPKLPASTAGTVLVNGSAITNYTLSEQGMLFRGTVDPNASVYYDSAVFAYPPVWPRGRQNITVTYQHGYADADLPRDVRGIALQAAARQIVQGVAISERVGDNQITYADPAVVLTPNERLHLRKYRR